MAEPEFQFHQPTAYLPGMMMTPSNPEMGQLMSMFAGQVLGPMFGAENFLPHLTAGSIGIMDQYAMRHFQNQQRISAHAIGTANNQNLATRLLALRTLGTEDPATEQNRNQAMNIANIINNPITKGLAAQIVGPETLEAVLHGTKGDVSQLHSATMRMGYYLRDPSGARRMGARSMEDFSRGVYAHLYEEGGDFERLEQEAIAAPDENIRRQSRQKLKQAARVRDDIDVITEADFVNRADTADTDVKEKINRIYKDYVQGNETDTLKQAAAIAKIQPAAAETGLLKEKEMLLPEVRREAEKMQVAQLHGLMAGQVGQMQEYMMQRGMLPQVVGAMSPADRVKLMGGPIDDSTLKRLATTAAERELFETNTAYRNMNDDEQKAEVAKIVDRHVDEIKTTSKAIEQFNAGTSNKSIEDLEQMGGFEAIAGNVDAQRTASALKKYSGAVDAVREIFGDNGNPNAPMPALLAALDHLTQGANFQMDSKNVESKLRQMQMTAREAGIGFEQMAAMSAQMGAMGDMLGLSPVAVMQSQVNAMAMIKTMRDGGAFANPRFGAMGQGEAQQVVAKRMIRGAASDNAKAMGAAANIYMAGKDSFAGTEFAAAMDAYLAGKTTYSYQGGTEKSLTELVGREGPAGITRLFTAAGGTSAELMTQFRSPLAQENARAEFGFGTQKPELLRKIQNLSADQTIAPAIARANKQNQNTLLAGQNADTVSAIAGKALTEMIVDSGTMKTDDQIMFIKRELPKQLQTEFKTAFNLTDDQARQMAGEAVDAIIGTATGAPDEAGFKKQLAEQNRRILSFRGQTDFLISHITGGEQNLNSFSQTDRYDTFQKTMTQAQENERIANHRAATAMGFKQHPFAAVSDLALRAGLTGQKLTPADMLTAMLKIVPDKKLAQRYTADLASGFDAVNKRLGEITYTDAYLTTLAEEGNKGSVAADTELKTLAARAGIVLNEKAGFQSSAAYEAAGKKLSEEILRSDDEALVRSAYRAASGESGDGTSLETIKNILSGSSKTAAKFRDQQAEKAFFKKIAEGSIELAPDKITATYSKYFDTADLAGKTTETLREELLRSDWAVSEGRKLAENTGEMSRQLLAAKLTQSNKIYGKLRDDAKAANATEKEVQFLTGLNDGVLGAADADTRRKLIGGLISTYGLANMNADAGTLNEQLDTLLTNTDVNDPEAKKKLDEFVKKSISGGVYSGDTEMLARAQQAAELVRRGAAIDAAGAGITTDPSKTNNVGDINTKDATINASGSTIVINGAATVKSGAAAAGGGQQESSRTWLQWLTGQEPTQAPASPAQAPTAAANAAASDTPTTAAASGAAAAAQDAAPQQDKPLSPTTPAPDNPKEKAAAEQAEQTYGTVPVPDGKETVKQNDSANNIRDRRQIKDPYATTIDQLKTELTRGTATEQLNAAYQMTAGQYVSPEMLRAAGYTVNDVNQPTSAALPTSGVSSANVVQTSTDAARQASIVAAGAEQTVRAPNAADGMPTGRNKPMEVIGELSIVNLEKAVLAVHSKSGQVAAAAGDMPVIG